MIENSRSPSVTDDRAEAWSAHESVPYPCVIPFGFQKATYYSIPPNYDGFKTVASMFVRDLLNQERGAQERTEIVGTFELAPSRWERGDSKSLSRFGVIVDSPEWTSAGDVVNAIRSLAVHPDYTGLRIVDHPILTAERALVQYRVGFLLYWIDVELKRLGESIRWMITLQNFAPRTKSVRA